jgi:integrase
MLISASSPQMATKLIISKECGLRPIEIITLKVKDIDLEKKLLYPTTVKHGAPRTLKISQRLKQAIEEHITKNTLKNEDKLFKGNAIYYGKSYRYTRNKLAKKLHDQTIKTIRLYDFRHYYGTTTYKKNQPNLHHEPNGTQTSRNHHDIHAPRRHTTRRRMDMQHRNHPRRNNKTHRKRIRTHNRQRRNKLLQKTQITLLFFYKCIHLVFSQDLTVYIL